MSERVSVGQTFRDLLSWRSEEGRGIFLMHYFSDFFFGERDFTCIRTVVGSQQSHKGMLLKYAGWGGWGVGGQKFSYSVMGVGGGRFISHVFHVFLRGGGNFFWGQPILTNPHPHHPQP